MLQRAKVLGAAAALVTAYLAGWNWDISPTHALLAGVVILYAVQKRMGVSIEPNRFNSLGLRDGASYGRYYGRRNGGR